MKFDRASVLQVRTQEGVPFSFRIASPMLRLIALVVDALVVIVAWSVISIPLMLLKFFAADFAGMIQFIGYFVLSQGYRIICEWRWRGQTLGKRLMNLRVIDEQGLRLRFAQAALRNLLRFVDVLPAAYLVGGVTALFTRYGQRLGDIAAGTVVIWEPPEKFPDVATLQDAKYNSLREHAPVVARLRQATSPRLARAAWQALARRERLDDRDRVELFAELAECFRGLTPLPPEVVDGISDEQLVRNVVEVLYINRSAAKKI